MRLTDPPALLVISAVAWVTLLFAIRSRVAAALGLSTLAAVALAQHKFDAQPDTTTLRAIAWLVLFLVAIANWALSASRKEKSTAAFIALGAFCFCVATVLETAFGSAWLAIAGAAAAWFSIAVLFAVFGRRLIYVENGSGAKYAAGPLRATFDELSDFPPELLDRKAQKIILALDEEGVGRCKVANLATSLAMSWQEAWIICALLSEIGLVYLSESDLGESASVELTDEGTKWLMRDAGATGGRGEVHLPSVTIMGDVILGEGGKHVEGDTYNVSGGNVTGAFGRNYVRDISSRASDGTAITQRDVVAEARSLAKQLPADKAKDVEDAANEVDRASGTNEVRRGVQRLIGIAAVLGNQAKPLLDLAKDFIESIAS